MTIRSAQNPRPLATGLLALAAFLADGAHAATFVRNRVGLATFW